MEPKNIDLPEVDPNNNEKQKNKRNKKGLLDLEVNANKGFFENFFHNYKRQLNYKPGENIIKPKESIQRHDKQIKETITLPNYQVLFGKFNKPTAQQLASLRLDTSRLSTSQLLNIKPIPSKKMEDDKKQGFSINEIPLKQFEKLGISQDTLIKSGLLDKLLKGERTNDLNNISITSKSGKEFNYSANFKLKRNEDGTIGIDVTHKKENMIEKIASKAIGKELSPEIAKEIKEKGITKIPDITNKKGENLFAYALYNNLTNQLQLLYPAKIKLPDQIKGVTITKEQQNELRQGKSIELQGMKDKKGNLFTAEVKINPQKKALSFSNPIAPKLEITEKKYSQGIKDKQEIPTGKKNSNGIKM